MREEILRRHRRLVVRAMIVRAWDVFLEAAFVMTSVAAALVLAERLAFEFGIVPAALSRPSVVLGLVGGALAAAAVAAVAAAIWWRVSPAWIAWAADRALRTDSLFLSAVEIARTPSGTAFDALVLEGAARASERLKPGKVMPLPRVRYRWAILLAIAAAAVLVAFAPAPAPVPVADFSVEPARGNAPLEVVLEEACIGRIEAFEWDFGDGTSERGRRLGHRYEKPGRYTVRLTVRGPGGEATVAREAVEVLAAGAPVADFTAAPEKGRAPLEVAFRNLSSNAERFVWRFGGDGESRERDPVYTFVKPGRYMVVLEAEGAGSTDRVERKITVVGPDAPVADFAAHPTRGEEPLEVRFENRSTGDITEYVWDFGDHLADESYDTDPVHVYRLPGTYTVKLAAKGPGGEDVEVKEHYIRVEEKGGGGGMSGRRPLQPPRREKRPDADAVWEKVRLGGGNPTESKIKKAPPKGGRGNVIPPHDRETFLRHRRAAEEAISRETIPEPVRQFVREYFEAIRPK
ncbi:MAG: PKD domain-containing protein [Planctomycetota bacterium]|jgi:PKD repeat protein